MIAVIGDSANAGSIGVHARCGFQMIGTHPSVGFKFGRWLDTVMMQRALGDGATTLPIAVARMQRMRDASNPAAERLLRALQ